jgi:hypothetical protein
MKLKAKPPLRRRRAAIQIETLESGDSGRSAGLGDAEAEVGGDEGIAGLKPRCGRFCDYRDGR